MLDTDHQHALGNNQPGMKGLEGNFVVLLIGTGDWTTKKMSIRYCWLMDVKY